MRKVVVGIIMGTLVFTSLLWAAGGKNRHGQDGTQPRTRSQHHRGVSSMWEQSPGQCEGVKQLRLRQGQLEGPGMGAEETGTRQRIRTRERNRDGSNETSKKHIRDRKRDGTCDIAEQTRTRTRTRSENRTGTS